MITEMVGAPKAKRLNGFRRPGYDNFQVATEQMFI